MLFRSSARCVCVSHVIVYTYAPAYEQQQDPLADLLELQKQASKEQASFEAESLNLLRTMSASLTKLLGTAPNSTHE